MMVVFRVREVVLFEVLERLGKLFYPHQIDEICRDESLGGVFSIYVSTSYDPPELLRRLKEHDLLKYLVCIKR